MKRTLRHSHTVVLLFALTATGLVFTVGAKGKPPSDTPVTTTIDGLGVDTTPTLRIQSDQLGAYRNSSSLQSILQAALGDWVLDMLNFNSSPQRTVLIDLRDPVSGSSINPFGATGYQYVRARFIAQCSQNGVDFRTMQPTNIYPCPMALAFDDANGVRYRLAQNPINYSETNWVQVTCVATDTNSKCNQWKLEPGAIQLSGERKNVAKLLKVATRPHQSDQDMGDFYMSFSIHLTNP
jgi:hypothetical protein